MDHPLVEDVDREQGDDPHQPERATIAVRLAVGPEVFVRYHR